MDPRTGWSANTRNQRSHPGSPGEAAIESQTTTAANATATPEAHRMPSATSDQRGLQGAWSPRRSVALEGSEG